jgi:hypothetical protein
MYRKPGAPLDGRSKLANGEPEHDGGQEGGWPRKRLIEMNREFAKRMERAIKLATEIRQAAAST